MEKEKLKVKPLSYINLTVDDECYSCAKITYYDSIKKIYYTTNPLQYKGKITNIEISPENKFIINKHVYGDVIKEQSYDLVNIVTFEDGTKISTDNNEFGFIQTECQKKNIFSKFFSNLSGCTGPDCVNDVVNGGKHQSRRYRKTKRSRKTRRHRKTKKSRKYRK